MCKLLKTSSTITERHLYHLRSNVRKRGFHIRGGIKVRLSLFKMHMPCSNITMTTNVKSPLGCHLVRELMNQHYLCNKFYN